MKQQIITGLKKKLLLVELPENASILRVTSGILTVEIQNDNLDTTDYIVPECLLIGKLTAITEEQFSEWVDWMTVKYGVMSYKNYYSISNPFKLTAKESFFSKLESLGIYFVNPLGEFPSKRNTGLPYGIEYLSKVARWEESQEKVWDKDRIWVFQIISK